MKVIDSGNKETLIQTNYTRETDKALLIENIDGDMAWVPLSQIEVVEMKEGTCELLIPNWLIGAKELL